MRARTKTQGWRRHLDGWQAAAVLLLLAGSAVLVGVPRAVPPTDIPLPRVDLRSLAATMAQDDQWAEQVQAEQLDVDIRAVGRELRGYNLAAANGDHDAMLKARAQVITTAAKAIKRSDEQLAQLRAYQTVRFIDELRRWQGDGVVTEELAALGGDFIDMLKRNRWCAPDGQTLLASERVLRTFYKKRWNEITSLTGPLFDLTIDEDRVRFGFLLEHPFRRKSDRGPVRPKGELAVTMRGQAQTLSVKRLSERDPEYPADFARGVVLYRMRRYPLAAEAFRRHLDRYPDGPYTLRARNHLKAALDEAAGGLI